jgi:hypothetical protein
LAELSAGGADAWSSARLCRGCVKIVGVDGAGIMLMSGEIPRGSLCTSNEVSHLIEELQYTLGEGPCVDAYQQNRVVAEPRLADPRTRRWFAFARRRWKRACGPCSGSRCGPARCAWGRSTSTGTGPAR